MSRHIFVITVTGELDQRLCDEFEDVGISVARGVTRFELVSPDPSALHGVLHRVELLGLELLEVSAADET